MFLILPPSSGFEHEDSPRCRGGLIDFFAPGPQDSGSSDALFRGHSLFCLLFLPFSSFSLGDRAETI